MADKILCELPFCFQSEDEKLYETVGIDTTNTQFESEVAMGVIDLNEIVQFNAGENPSETCIRLSYISFNIKVPYQDFKDLYSKATGREILSYGK
ncbi:MAG: hypothetical protein ACM3P0_17980 [Acidobacteriota bacterium]